MSVRTPRQAVERSERMNAPPVYEPQLATLVDTPPTGEQWVHELKYDGYRMGCAVRGDEVVIESRNGKDWTPAFPEIVAALRTLGLQSALFDGEASVLLADGRTSFQGLQNAFAGGPRKGLTYIAFDLLALNGKDLRNEPLETRKEALRAVLPATGILRYSEHLEGDGAAVLAKACALGAEGIVSKRRDQPYRGGRNKAWLKAKCSLRQEFVIGGFTEPEGSRVGIGALLLGYYDDGRLVFAGKVGTGRGFTSNFLAALRRQLEPLRAVQSPFAVRLPTRYLKGAHWLKPVTIAEVTFTEWTSDGHVRHPSLQGLRSDKDPTAIVRENPVAAAAAKQRRE